ncbi:MAG: hypothetical protein AAGK21_07125 [Bacteroidota bacterium]
MSRAFVLLLVLYSGCAGAQPDGAQPAMGATDLIGQYVAIDSVQVYTGTDWEPRAVENTMDLTARGDTLRLRLDLVQTNAHMCWADLDLTQAADTLWQAATDWGCSLQLAVEPTSLQVLDPDNTCRRRLCGARAVLDGATFPRPPAGPPAPDEPRLP